MGRAKNTINPAEVSTTPIKVRYYATYLTSSFSENGITVLSGSNIPYSVNLTPSKFSKMLNYRLIKQLYYNYYLSGSIIGSASFWDPWWQSTAASSSGDNTVYYLPTGSNEQIYIFSIPPYKFGEQIAKNTLFISGSDSSYTIIDDGNGNIIDIANNNENVGNIFYAQGIFTVTNQDYMPANYLATEDYNVYETQNDIDIILE